MAGAPTKYNQKLLEKAQHYLENFDDYGSPFPSVYGLSKVLDVSRATLQAWKADRVKNSDKLQFLDILDKIHSEQEEVAWKRGLDGTYNAMLVKLLLGKHGYHEKSAQEITGADGGAIKTENKNWTVEVVKPDAKPTDT